MPDLEREIFDAASEKDDFTTEPTVAEPTPTPEPETPDAPVPEPEPSDPQPEHQHEEANRGDPRVALRQEREASKALKAELERERAERVRFMNMLERQQAPQPQPAPQAEPEKPDFWADPDAWIASQFEARGKSYEDQIFQTREHFSRQMAVREHGEERVAAARQALEAEIDAGRLDPQATVKALRASTDPYADILKWHEGRPEVQERSMRERIEAEIRQKYGLTDDGDPAPAAPRAPAPANLPSLNRAIGNAGASQGGSISEDDIFNAAPAFGRRKA